MKLCNPNYVFIQARNVKHPSRSRHNSGLAQSTTDSLAYILTTFFVQFAWIYNADVERNPLQFVIESYVWINSVVSFKILNLLLFLYFIRHWKVKTLKY